jgi:hypothetical protein
MSSVFIAIEWKCTMSLLNLDIATIIACIKYMLYCSYGLPRLYACISCSAELYRERQCCAYTYCSAALFHRREDEWGVIWVEILHDNIREVRNVIFLREIVSILYFKKGSLRSADLVVFFLRASVWVAENDECHGIRRGICPPPPSAGDGNRNASHSWCTNTLNGGK